MSKGAARTFHKVVKICPYCGAKGPKELVEGEKKINWVVFWLLLFCTIGFGLIFVDAWYKSHLEAYCEHCKQPFAV